MLIAAGLSIRISFSESSALGSVRFQLMIVDDAASKQKTQKREGNASRAVPADSARTRTVRTGTVQ